MCWPYLLRAWIQQLSGSYDLPTLPTYEIQLIEGLIRSPAWTVLPLLCIFHTQWNRKTAASDLSNGHRKKRRCVCHSRHWAHTKSGDTSVHFVIALSSLINNETLCFWLSRCARIKIMKQDIQSRWLAGASMSCISEQNECYRIGTVIR